MVIFNSNRYKNKSCTKENLSSNNLAFTHPRNYVLTVSDRRCVVSRCEGVLIEIHFSHGKMFCRCQCLSTE